MAMLVFGLLDKKTKLKYNYLVIQIYKPTAKNTGCAISLNASDRDKYLYIELIRQFSWDVARKKGSFIENRKRPGMNTVLKFNQTEVGALLDAIERFYEFKPFHSSEKKVTQISFAPAEGDSPTTYVFKVLQSDADDSTKKASFFIPINFGEARLIREYLVYYLHKSFKMAFDSQSNKKFSDMPTDSASPQADNAPDTQAVPESNSADW